VQLAEVTGAALLAAGCAFSEYSVDEDVVEDKLGAPPAECPTDLDGPEMVAVPGGYCIDGTEVTWEQYTAWSDSAPDDVAQAPGCSDNHDVEPSPACSAPSPVHPVVCVDWCDAWAYCESVGKRLCGRVGGGQNGFSDFDDPELSEWHAVCTAAGRYAYPYGDDYNVERCHTETETVGHFVVTAEEAGGHEDCEPRGSYAGVFDLSGNVDEWVHACNAEACRTRGGAAHYFEADGSTAMRCDAARSYERNQQLDFVGFRCCYTAD
jgi:formylglycine-generating enzyme required for sulfatase activity